MLMILGKMVMLCSVILIRLTAVALIPTELGSGTFLMELKLELGVPLNMNFTEIEERKLCASIIDKAHLQKGELSDVKYQMLIIISKISP